MFVVTCCSGETVLIPSLLLDVAVLDVDGIVACFFSLGGCSLVHLVTYAPSTPAATPAALATAAVDTNQVLNTKLDDFVEFGKRLEGVSLFSFEAFSDFVDHDSKRCSLVHEGHDYRCTRQIREAESRTHQLTDCFSVEKEVPRVDLDCVRGLKSCIRILHHISRFLSSLLAMYVIENAFHGVVANTSLGGARQRSKCPNIPGINTKRR